MDVYEIAVFFHVLGAVGIFVAWGIEAVAFHQIRGATTAEEARVGLLLRGRSIPLGPAGMILALGTGFWMMWDRWGQQPWMTAALVGLAVIVVMGIAVERMALPRLTAAANGDRARLPHEQRSAIMSLVASLTIRIAVGVGILALMTMKPGAAGSAAILVAAIVVGAVLAFGLTREARPGVTAST